jgi:hypothetical protein
MVQIPVAWSSGLLTEQIFLSMMYMDNVYPRDTILPKGENQQPDAKL